MHFNIEYDESKTRQKQRNLILNQAYRLFIDKGIMNVTMQDIAKASDTQRRTLYYYYNSKDAIAMEIAKYTILEMKTQSFNVPSYLTTCYSRIEYLLHYSLDFLLQNEDMVLFIVQSDYYFREENSNPEYEQMLAEHPEFYKGILLLFKPMLHDGSIKNEYADNIEEFLFVSMSAISGMVHRTLFREDMIKRDSGYDRKSIVMLVDIILKGIKS